MQFNKIKILIGLSGTLLISSCNKTLDINKDPDRLPTEGNNPIPQLLTSAQVNLAFENGSDLFRYVTLIMQQMSGGASQPNQTYEYYRHNITGSDINNVWSSMFATTLSDLELIIKQGSASPYYTGIAKILKAYEYSQVIDVWGDVPYTEAQQLLANTQPKYEDDAVIYPKLITLLTDAVTDLNAASSLLVPGNNSVMYTGTYATIKTNWIKLANTLKLRLLLHYSKLDPAFCVAQITALVNTGGPFFTSNADNFQVAFYDVANQRNPISQFEVSRPNYLFADTKIVGIMNSKTDPRRPYYFTSFPYSGLSLPTSYSTSGTTAGGGNVLQFSSTTGISVGTMMSGANIPFGTTATAVTATTVTLSNNVTGGGVGLAASVTAAPNTFTSVSATALPATPNNNYSRIHTFLRGNVTAGATPPFTYSGSAPQRLLTYAEYCFIRAEAALRGAVGDPQAFFTAGITANMQEVGVNANDIANYITANGTLTGTTAQKLQQIIEEKYVALFGINVEPWNDWRRTGYPALSVPTNSITGAIPRTLFYAQSEIDLNPNNPGQKNADLQGRVFWDN